MYLGYLFCQFLKNPSSTVKIISWIYKQCHKWWIDPMTIIKMLYPQHYVNVIYQIKDGILQHWQE